MKRTTRTRVAPLLIASLFAACAATTGSEPPGTDDMDQGKGDGTGSGSGTGTGSGSGTGTGSGTPTGTSASTASEFLQGMNTKFCDQAFTCKASFPATTGETFEGDFGATQQDCYAMGFDATEAALVDAQVQAGKIRFDAGAASTCLAGIAAVSCTAFWNGDGPQECGTALVGTVADGGACMTYFDCSGQTSYCDETTQKCVADTSAP